MFQRNKRTIWIIGCILIILVSLSANVFAQYAVGDTVPDFTLTNLSGEEVSLSDFQGQVILLNFFTTW